MRIGVLAVQGAFAEHISALGRLGVEAVPVRLPHELNSLDGLIIPGGESTTIDKLTRAYNLSDEISAMARDGVPLMGTCAGMILLAKHVSDGDVAPLGLMDITVRRNAFGRQRNSFETMLPIKALGEAPFPAVFIRAPIIEEAGEGVEVLAAMEGGGVAARQGNLLVCAFHPELTEDLRFHRYFVEIATKRHEMLERRMGIAEGNKR